MPIKITFLVLFLVNLIKKVLVKLRHLLNNKYTARKSQNLADYCLVILRLGLAVFIKHGL